MPNGLMQLGPIVLLLGAIALVITRLPKVDVGHSPAFLRRRFLNWFPVGLTYAFLYMARYNLSVAKDLLDPRLFSKEDFGTVFAVGTLTYGFSFVVNGPLTDKLGGRKTILMAAAGAIVANVCLGAMIVHGMALVGALPPDAKFVRPGYLLPSLSALYALNMYFQSFGAVSIVKINSAWFHLKERGTFGGIFGILISLGVYFAYDWGRKIGEGISKPAMFFIPSGLLAILSVWLFFMARDTPEKAGFEDFDTGDAKYEVDESLSSFQRVVVVAKSMLRNRIILTIAAIEFCSGYLRNAIMQWYMSYASAIGAFTKAKGGVPALGEFVPRNWGLMLCLAGIFGGMFAGIISDRIFQSRRGPVSAVLYGMMVLGTLAMFPLLGSPSLGVLAVFLSMCFIGVHGMLSGTASMDFGGKQNVGIAVGIIDGFVYLGTGLESLILGKVLPKADLAKNAANWTPWPVVMLPASVLGFLLALTLWNAKPTRAGSGH